MSTSHQTYRRKKSTKARREHFSKHCALMAASGSTGSARQSSGTGRLTAFIIKNTHRQNQQQKERKTEKSRGDREISSFSPRLSLHSYGTRIFLPRRYPASSSLLPLQLFSSSTSSSLWLLVQKERQPAICTLEKPRLSVHSTRSEREVEQIDI